MTNGEGDPLGTVQEPEIWPYWQIVYAHHNLSGQMRRMKFFGSVR